MEDEIKIAPVAPQLFIQFWNKVETLLEDAMPVMLNRYWPIDIIAILIADPTFLGWFVIEGEELLAIMVTQVIRYPRASGLNLFLVSGKNMVKWFAQAEDTLSKYAITKGCTFFECSGRRGWERRLKLEPRAVFYVKDLNCEVLK